MKIFVLLLSIGFSLTAHGQKITCKSLHQGKFKVTTKESGTTIITRKNNLQTEENAELGAKIIFTIDWITQCSYELRPKQVIQGDSSILHQGIVLKVMIKEIKNNKYIAETTSNFSDAKIDFEVEIIN